MSLDKYFSTSIPSKEIPENSGETTQILETVSRSKKQYLSQNVYDATIERIDYLLDEFPNLYLSFSGGKDSTVLLHLTIQEARKKHCLPVKVLFIDLEAQYKATIHHVEEMMLDNPEIDPYWIALPFNLRNAVSVYQPQWVCWNKHEREKWVRPMPEYSCVINQATIPKEWNWYYEGMEFEEFIGKFGLWMRDRSGSPILTAALIAIRADESLNRFLAVKKESDEPTYKGKAWTTKFRKDLYNAYPIYDWKTEDIWTVIGKKDLAYNRIYDLIYLTGKSIHETRICQPYGDDQRQGLDLFRKVEPETWGKVVQRVSGANLGNIYCSTELLGHRKTIKPSHLSWREYANFLLSTIPKYQSHIYKERIEQFFDWWEENEFWMRNNVPDATPPKNDPRWLKPDGTRYRKIPSWERIAKCILKNDINCKSLSFGCVVGGYPRYLKLKQQYGE